MRHADALSRCHNILLIEENTFERNLSIVQDRDKEINKIRDQLENTEDKHYELRNGLVYRKHKGKLLFYVPKGMLKNRDTYHAMMNLDIPQLINRKNYL